MSLKTLAHAIIERSSTKNGVQDDTEGLAGTDGGQPESDLERIAPVDGFNVVPDSRSPLLPDAIRSKIEAIESEARRLGWPAELLWNAGFWDRPRGLAALLDIEDEITEVTADCIAILKCRRDIQRFRRTNA